MKSEAIRTVRDAIAFLRTVDVEVIGITHGWIVRGVGQREGEFELTCDSDAELIEFARAEQGLLVKLCRHVGLSSPAELPRYSLSLPVVESRDVLLSAWVYAPFEEMSKGVKP